MASLDDGVGALHHGRHQQTYTYYGSMLTTAHFITAATSSPPQLLSSTTVQTTLSKPCSRP